MEDDFESKEESPTHGKPLKLVYYAKIHSSITEETMNTYNRKKDGEEKEQVRYLRKEMQLSNECLEKPAKGKPYNCN